MELKLLRIPVEQVAVIGRARQDLGDIQELVDDMLVVDNGHSRGQLQPGVVRPPRREDVEEEGLDPTKTPWILVAGGRRYAAVCLAGFDYFYAIDKGDLSPLLQKIYELHENLLRKSLTWAEEVLLKDNIHDLRKLEAREHGQDWTQTQTGDEVHESVANISRDLALAAEIKKDPTLANATSKLAAVQIVKERRSVQERTARLTHAPLEKLRDRIRILDAIKFSRMLLAKDSVDLSFADLRIQHDPNNPNDRGARALRDDLLVNLIPEMVRTTRESGWIVILVNNEASQLVHQLLSSLCTAHGEYAELEPHKDDNTVWQLNPAKYCGSVSAGPGSSCRFLTPENPNWWWVTGESSVQLSEAHLHAASRCEPLHIVNMGTAVINKPGSDVLIFEHLDDEDKLHEMQLPHNFCREIVTRLTVGGERVADFCYGSGAMLAAAIELERDIIGADNDPAMQTAALALVSEHFPKHL